MDTFYGLYEGYDLFEVEHPPTILAYGSRRLEGRHRQGHRGHQLGRRVRLVRRRVALVPAGAGWPRLLEFLPFSGGVPCTVAATAIVVSD